MIFAIVYDCRKGWLLPLYCDSDRVAAQGVETWQLVIKVGTQGFIRRRKR